ncbi:hypothetical protein FB451DRAFT_1370363 [Mycena latifolia]|nr:hypothetical protein FB451DRAFT_1370363 [Mycena latifolia]
MATERTPESSAQQDIAESQAPNRPKAELRLVTLVFQHFFLPQPVMSYNPPHVFPGAWIECMLDDDDDKGVRDNPPSPNPPQDIAASEETIGSHAAAIERYRGGTALSTGSGPSTDTAPQCDEEKTAMSDMVLEPPAKTGDAMDVDPEPVTSKPASLDLLHSVKGLFRVLDLISESGSGGLVDKVIIAQDSLKELINVLCPGAYASLIKVDFKALDKLAIKPLGLYGSKSEIIAFLSCRGVINEETARALSQSTDNTSVPHLRSGLYILRARNTAPAGPQQIFVIYWPENTTWNDDAISSVRRNRDFHEILFRYLTKIADQVTCLISPEHARAIVWNPEAEELPMDLDEESDRLFTFEVAKTNEQDEGVSVRPGFTINTPILSVEQLHVECTLDASELQPILVQGETRQAILTKHFVPSNFVERLIRGETHTPVKLRSLISNGSIRLSPILTDEGIEILMDHGLDSRYPVPFTAWKARNQKAKESIEADGKKEEQETYKKLQEDSQPLESVLREAIVDRLLHLFPTVQRTVLSSSSNEHIEVLRAQYTSLVSVHPKLKDEIDKATSGDKSEHARLPSKFKVLREQILCIEIILKKRSDLEMPDRQDLIEHMSENGMDGLALAVKSRDSRAERKGFFAKLASLVSDEQSTTTTDRIRRQVRDRLAADTDSQFLAHLDGLLVQEPLLQDIITRAVEMANEGLQGTLKKLLGRFIGRAILIQQEALKLQVQRKTAGKLEEQRRVSRLQLIKEYEAENPDSSVEQEGVGIGDIWWSAGTLSEGPPVAPFLNVPARLKKAPAIVSRNWLRGGLFAQNWLHGGYFAQNWLHGGYFAQLPHVQLAAPQDWLYDGSFAQVGFPAPLKSLRAANLACAIELTHAELTAQRVFRAALLIVPAPSICCKQNWLHGGYFPQLPHVQLAAPQNWLYDGSFAQVGFPAPLKSLRAANLACAIELTHAELTAQRVFRAELAALQNWLHGGYFAQNWLHGGYFTQGGLTAQQVLSRRGQAARRGFVAVFPAPFVASGFSRR